MNWQQYNRFESSVALPDVTCGIWYDITVFKTNQPLPEISRKVSVTCHKPETETALASVSGSGFDFLLGSCAYSCTHHVYSPHGVRLEDADKLLRRIQQGETTQVRCFGLLISGFATEETVMCEGTANVHVEAHFFHFLNDLMEKYDLNLTDLQSDMNGEKLFILGMRHRRDEVAIQQAIQACPELTNHGRIRFDISMKPIEHEKAMS